MLIMPVNLQECMATTVSFDLAGVHSLLRQPVMPWTLLHAQALAHSQDL